MSWRRRRGVGGARGAADRRFDYAWNMLVKTRSCSSLKPQAKQDKHRRDWAVEFIRSRTDPATEVDGERASLKTKHPLFSDPAVQPSTS